MTVPLLYGATAVQLPDPLPSTIPYREPAVAEIVPDIVKEYDEPPFTENDPVASSFIRRNPMKLPLPLNFGPLREKVPYTLKLVEVVCISRVRLPEPWIRVYSGPCGSILLNVIVPTILFGFVSVVVVISVVVIVVDFL